MSPLVQILGGRVPRVPYGSTPLHMRSQCVTCHQTHVNAPRDLTLARQASTRCTYPGGMEGWVDLGG